MRVLLVHGWGFAPSLWDALRARPGHTWLTVDLGYFGPPRWDLPPALDLVAGHSFGCLWAMLHPGLAQVPLVSVAGFPRLRAGPDFPHGIPARVLERMLARLRQSPPEALQALHDRLGTAVPRGEPRLERLQADLLGMRDRDARGGRQPVLALAAEDDPLVPAALSRHAFPRLVRLPSGGHALPLTRPGAVARALEAAL